MKGRPMEKGAAGQRKAASLRDKAKSRADVTGKERAMVSGKGKKKGLYK